MWFSIGKAIFDNPLARWIGGIAGILLGLRIAEAWIRRDAEQKERRRIVEEYERAEHERREKGRARRDDMRDKSRDERVRHTIDDPNNRLSVQRSETS